MILLFRIFWELPQNILGLTILLINKIIYKEKVINSKYKHSFIFGVNTNFANGSFGLIMILYKKRTQLLIEHEYGHSIQSMFLGPLYLLIIGIPSLINYIIHYYKFKKQKKLSFYSRSKMYYSFYTESWANKLVLLNYYRLSKGEEYRYKNHYSYNKTVAEKIALLSLKK